MAQVNVHVVLLVALAALVVFSSPGMASRTVLRHPIDKRLGFRPSFHRRNWNGAASCIPEAAHLIEDHEGRHKCAYDHEHGYRAVGAGYNLDVEKEQKRAEVEYVAQADYEKVYKGEVCLNDQQISGLLVMDAQRALERAEKNIRRLQDFCCRVQAVFADIQHWAGRAEDFPKGDMKRFIEEAGKEQYESAADELGKTDWCSKKANERTCDDNVDRVARGCERNPSIKCHADTTYRGPSNC